MSRVQCNSLAGELLLKRIMSLPKFCKSTNADSSSAWGRPTQIPLSFFKKIPIFFAKVEEHSVKKNIKQFCFWRNLLTCVIMTSNVLETRLKIFNFRQRHQDDLTRYSRFPVSMVKIQGWDFTKGAEYSRHYLTLKLSLSFENCSIHILTNYTNKKCMCFYCINV